MFAILATAQPLLDFLVCVSHKLLHVQLALNGYTKMDVSIAFLIALLDSGVILKLVIANHALEDVNSVLKAQNLTVFAKKVGVHFLILAL